MFKLWTKSSQRDLRLWLKCMRQSTCPSSVSLAPCSLNVLTCIFWYISIIASSHAVISLAGRFIIWTSNNVGDLKKNKKFWRLSTSHLAPVGREMKLTFHIYCKQAFPLLTLTFKGRRFNHVIGVERVKRNFPDHEWRVDNLAVLGAEREPDWWTNFWRKAVNRGILTRDVRFGGDLRKNFFTKRLVEIYKALPEKLVEAGTLMISKRLSADTKCPAM